MLRKKSKPHEGARLPETADMKAWREEFDEMKEEDHLKKLAELGLSDEDLEEFKEMEKGELSEEELLSEEPTKKPSEKVKKSKK
jgi:hypothetical protein